MSQGGDVKPYVQRGKSDTLDAEAICEAVSRPTMRFAAVKTVEQQSALTLHRTRVILVKQETMLANLLRGCAAEFGIVATIGSVANFKSARHFAAFLGLTPKEHSTGGKQRLGRISKQGDAYIRRLLILGGTALVAALSTKDEQVAAGTTRKTGIQFDIAHLINGCRQTAISYVL